HGIPRLRCASLGMTSCGYAPSKSRHRQSCENPIDYRLACHALGFGLVAHDDAVAQNIRPDAFDILRRDIAAAVEERIGARGEREVNRRPRRSAVTDQAFEFES